MRTRASGRARAEVTDLLTARLQAAGAAVPETAWPTGKPRPRRLTVDVPAHRSRPCQPPCPNRGPGSIHHQMPPASALTPDAAPAPSATPTRPRSRGSSHRRPTRTYEDAVSMPCRWYGETVTSARWMRQGRPPRAVPALQPAGRRRAAVACTTRPGAVTLWQLALHPALPSLGIGTALVTAAEQRTLRLAP
jgi:hypothetical protein